MKSILACRTKGMVDLKSSLTLSYYLSSMLQCVTNASFHTHATARSSTNVLVPITLINKKSNNLFTTQRFFQKKSDLHKKNVKLFSTYGVGMNQSQLMESDRLIAVTEKDKVISSGRVVTKKEAHSFNKHTPRGVLHRAFSVFLFNSKNELLLTQRASSKLTFPSVWTNTCCSHPLQNMIPNEVDYFERDFPDFPGIKNAAIRKLVHELGMNSKQISPVDKYQFISRFHYWAADAVTYGKGSIWGEHEVDYVLFIQILDDDIQIHPNPDEVEDYKFISMVDLKTMIKESGEKWSPWFLGIMERGGWRWWENLEDALAGKITLKNIEFFDPPKEFWADYNLPEHDKTTGVLSSPSKV